jgi:hypothetical protein
VRQWDDVEMKTIFYIDATSLTPYTLASVHTLAAGLSSMCHIVVALNSPTDVSIDGVQIICLDNTSIFNNIIHRKDISKGIVPGNPDLKLIASLPLLPEFDVLVRVEYDIVVIGDSVDTIADLIEVCKGFDFCASYISEKTQQNQDWMWWSSLSGPDYLRSDPLMCRRKAFLPVMAASKRYFDIYKFALASGWSGHYEVLMPTLAAYFGMEFYDLSGGKRPFTSYPAFGAHTLSEYPSRLPRIVHPIKDFDALSRLTDAEHGRAPLLPAGGSAP